MYISMICLQILKQNGTFVLNCIWSPEELEENLPGSMKRELAAKNANFYIINAVKIGEDIGLGNRINMIMQSAFFALSKVIPLDEAIAHLKDQVVANYGFMGDDIVAMNYKAIEMGSTAFTKLRSLHHGLTLRSKLKKKMTILNS